MRTRPVTAAVGCVLLVAAGAGCGSSPPDERTGTLVYADGSPFPENLFPLIGAGNSIAVTNILVRVLPAPFRSRPDYTIGRDDDLRASEPTVEETDTGQIVTYALNPEAVWSDGEPITVDDFEFTWRLQRSSDPSDGGCPALLGTIGYDQIESVRAGADESTVVVTFAGPFADWKSLFTLFPAHVMDEGDDAANCTATTTGWPIAEGVPEDISGGPWQLKTENIDVGEQTMTLTPNPQWYGDGPWLERLIHQTIDTAVPNVAVAALRSGEVHLISAKPQLDLAVALRQLAPGVTLDVTFGLSFLHLDLNTVNVHLVKPEVRRAFALSLDRAELVAATAGQFDARAQVLNNRFYVNTQPEYQDTAPAQYNAPDIAGAKDLLESAGYVLGPDGVYAHPLDGPLRLTLSTLPNSPLFEQTIDLASVQAAKAGFAITKSLDPDIFGGPDRPTSLESRGFDIALFTWTSSPYVSGLFALYRTGGGQNYAGVSNAAVDGLLDQLSTEVDAEAAADLANRADRLLWEEMVTIPLYQYPTVTAWSSDFEGIAPNATSAGPLWNSEEFRRGRG